MKSNVARWLVSAVSLCCLSGCAAVMANFDATPGGAVVQGQTGPVLEGGSVASTALISNQYASDGLTFSSGSPAVFAAAFGPTDAPSAPNAACPTQSNGTAGYSTATKIDVSKSNICNAWVTITKTSGPTTMTAFDFNGNQIGPTVSSHGSSPTRAGAAETLHINACDIKRIQLAGTNYCFDDVKISR